MVPMKASAPILTALLCCSAICPSASGQAAVEYGLGAGRAATTAAPARGAGKQIGGVFDSLNQTMKGQPDSTPEPKPSIERKSVRTVRSTAKPAPQPVLLAVTYEDPQQITVGIGYDELVRRFGPPSMSITTGADGKTLSYVGHGGMVGVEVVSGHVVSVSGRMTPAKSATAIVP